MSALQQIRQFVALLRQEFDQQIAQLPVLGRLFASKWNIIYCDKPSGFSLLTKDGAKRIPQQVEAVKIKGRNCLRLAPNIGQLRTVRLPNAALSDPTSAIRLSLDTLSPIAPDDTAFAVQSVSEIEGSVMFDCVIALTSKSRLGELLQSGQELGLQFAAIDVTDSDQSMNDPIIDLATGQRATTAMSPSGVLAVICAVLLSSALLLNFWVVGKLNPEQEALRAQVSPSDFSMARLQRTERQKRLSITETWSAVSTALPDSAWAESLLIDKQQLRLAGHARNAAELVGALEANPALSDVGLAAASIQETEGEESFDLQATIQASGGVQ